MKKSSAVTAEQVTRRFYQRFSSIRASFLASLYGIEAEDARQAYASLLLNRLLFVFFLQDNGFLDHDTRYLFKHLQLTQTQFGPDAFFRHFLLRFFYEGLPQRTPELVALFGALPLLEMQLFQPHPLEDPALNLSIADEAFRALFTFLASYHWCLDERQLRTELTITPALLGHIFELSLKQQEMGAYYTPEDATEYIARNTLIAYLFSEVARAVPAAFVAQGPIWSRLRLFPERYIPAALKAAPMFTASKSVTEDVEGSGDYERLRGLLASGTVCSIDECITYNLDIAAFARDILLDLSSSELVLQCYQVLETMRLLDPTCGAGAFLFAALATLVPLYEACLTRMQGLFATGEAEMLFRDILARVAGAPNLRSFVLHAILTHNLYGVDLMAEAIELCKLRFALLLLSEMPETSAHSMPLASLTPHLCMGNALIGFAFEMHDLPNQTTVQPILPIASEALDHMLAEKDYGITPPAFAAWRARHQPFHWCLAFPEIMEQGGFSVIVGNPPYVEYDVRNFSYTLRNYKTLPCANLYPCVVERSSQLLSRHGRIGMILPLAAFATRNMLPLQRGVRAWFPGTWLSFYHFRPAMLFSGGKIASIPTLILLGRGDGPEQRFSSHLLKWSKKDRASLFSTFLYCEITASSDPANPHYYPKFGQSCENSIMEKILRHPCMREYLVTTPNQNTLYYRSAGGLYWKVFLNFPWPYHTTSNKLCSFQLAYDRDIFVALLNSSLFWWYYTVTFDSFNLKDYMLFGFRFSYPDDPALIACLKALCQELMGEFFENARHLKRGATDSYTLYVKKSKPLLDEIDLILAQVYGLTSEEYRFIIAYDLKYRMSTSAARS